MLSNLTNAVAFWCLLPIYLLFAMFSTWLIMFCLFYGYICVIFYNFIYCSMVTSCYIIVYYVNFRCYWMLLDSLWFFMNFIALFRRTWKRPMSRVMAPSRRIPLKEHWLGAPATSRQRNSRKILDDLHISLQCTLFLCAWFISNYFKFGWDGVSTCEYLVCHCCGWILFSILCGCFWICKISIHQRAHPNQASDKADASMAPKSTDGQKVGDPGLPWSFYINVSLKTWNITVYHW